MGKLSDRRVLILEDEFLIAHDMAAIVLRAGGSVGELCRCEGDVERAIGNETFDLAVLDVRLRDQDSFATAASLRERSIPFVFVTGYDEAHLPPQWRGIPRCPKPIEPAVLVNMLASLIRRPADLV